MGINADSVVRVSMFWLIAAYLFHTLGELCISPVGLSYVSKLVPAAWIELCLGCIIYSSEWGINWRV
jgi:POT family proton-dependent oligopeptide transporter